MDMGVAVTAQRIIALLVGADEQDIGYWHQQHSFNKRYLSALFI
jgi:hypothetical protein